MMPPSAPALPDPEQLRLLAENSLDALFLTHPDGRVVYANPTAARMFGRTREEICRLGRTALLDPSDPRLAAALDVRARTGSFEGELTALAADGRRFPVEVASRVFTGDDGAAWTSVSLRDITRRRRAEDALRTSEARHRLLIESAGVGVVYHDGSGRVVLANDAAAALLGVPAGTLAGRSPRELLGESIGAIVEQRIAETIAAAGRRTFETRHELPIGTRWIVAQYNAIASPGDGAGAGVQVVLTDTTERRRTEEALRASEAQYHRMFSAMTEGFALHEIVCDAAGTPVDYRFLDANDAFFAMTGLPPGALGRTVRELLPDVEPEWIETYGRVALTGQAATFTRHAAALGKHFEVRAYSPQPGRFVTLFLDVSERHRAGEEAHRRLRQLLAVSRLGVVLSERLDERDLLRTAAEEIQRAFGYYNVALLLHDPAGGMLGRQALAGALAAHASPDYALRVGEGLIGSAALHGVTVVANDVVADPRYVEGFPQARATRAEAAVPIKRGGEVLAVLDVQEDEPGAFDETDVLTLETLAGVIAVALHNARLFAAAQHELAERARAEEEYRQLFEAESDAILLVDNEEGRILAANGAAAAMYGYSRDELLGMRNSDLSAEPEQTRAVTGSTPPRMDEVVSVPLRRHRTRDGTVFPVEITGRFFVRAGRSVHIAAIRDISARLCAQEALREREEQLRHAQKMEAVGRLAGGVAHDFNNLLQGLLSYTSVLRSARTDPERLASISEEIGRHVQRAVALTRQLLLFSRRSPRQTEAVDLNAVVRASASFLRHLLRENIASTVETCNAPLVVAADRGQIDQVLMNLVVNAADAMPAGGGLSVTTSEVDPGWAEIAVSDSGHGISAEIRERIFEPFFTTKEAGRGTGLGLSVVHGIVEEHGGTITVESEPMVGTTFRVRLPRLARHDGDTSGESRQPADGTHTGRGERVLVVEDEEAARQGLREVLGLLGYRASTARSAEEALPLANAGGFDLVLTDLLLPGATGMTLARSLRSRFPSLRVVLMSGYAEDEAIRQAIADGEVRFLQKPFDMDALAQALREALTAPPDAGT